MARWAVTAGSATESAPASGERGELQRMPPAALPRHDRPDVLVGQSRGDIGSRPMSAIAAFHASSPYSSAQPGG